MEKINKNKMLKEVTVCRSFLSKVWGFMLSKSKKPKLFVFSKEQRVCIHTFFCLIHLRISYFNKDFKLIKEITAAPFKILMPIKAKYVLETPL